MASRNSKNSPVAVNPAARQEKKKLRRGIFALLLLLFIVVSGGFLLYWLDHQFFDRNERFTLKEVEILSSGYWGKSSENRADLIRRLALHPGMDNLFALQPEKIRAAIRAIPNVADASVERVLPDTLSIRIEERVPRAFLGRSNSELVVDANGMVMNARQCFGVQPRLPVIVGLKNTDIREGAPLPELRGALDLIMQAYRGFPEFQVVLVSVSRPDRLFLFLNYRNAQRYYVTMPVGNIPVMLDVLRSAIEDARSHRDTRRNINLMFDGSVIMSGQ